MSTSLTTQENWEVENMGIYEFPKVSRYRIHKLIFDIRNSDILKAEFLRDQDGIMKRYGLSEEETRLLKRGDPIEMYKFGVFPYLLHYYWLAIKGASKGSREDMTLFEADE